MNELNAKMMAKIRMVRDNNPAVVDNLLAALELVPMVKDDPMSWLNKVSAGGLLDYANYRLHITFLTYEAIQERPVNPDPELSTCEWDSWPDKE